MNDRYLQCRYATYYNKMGRQYVKIHLLNSPLSKNEMNDIVHKYKQGSWAYFVEKYEAEEYAKHVSRSAGVEMSYCMKCKPDGF